MKGDNYTKSPTLELHGPKDQWVGNVVFSDNHTEQIENFFPSQTTYEPTDGSGGPVKDNIFASEFGTSPRDGMSLSDSFMVICIYASRDGEWVLPRYDKILD